MSLTISLTGFGCSRKIGRQYGQIRIARKSPLSRDHLIKHQPKAENIRARIQTLAFSLFGRHVGDGPQ